MERYGNENPGAFQPTRPLRGATAAAKRAAHERPISTHAPLAGRDAAPKQKALVLLDFNPRAPCGARPGWAVAGSGSSEISTHAPLAGRDYSPWSEDGEFEISTHAPLAGRDPLRYDQLDVVDISTHAPLAGRDCMASSTPPRRAGFQPTRPLRGAT